VAIMDFTVPREEIQVKIDDDVFDAYPALPGLVVLEFSERASAIDTEATGDAAKKELLRSLELVLQPESFALFSRRLADYAKPIDLRQVNKIIPWLMEQYGLRPTEPSSSSSSGEPNPDDGTSSTDDSQVVALTSVG